MPKAVYIVLKWIIATQFKLHLIQPVIFLRISGDLIDDPTSYRSLDEALQYLTFTRLDIYVSYAI